KRIFSIEDDVLVGIVKQKIIKIGIFEKIFSVTKLRVANFSNDIVQIEYLLAVDVACTTGGTVDFNNGGANVHETVIAEHILGEGEVVLEQIHVTGGGHKNNARIEFIFIDFLLQDQE